MTTGDEEYRSWTGMVRQFHTATSVPVLPHAQLPSEERRQLRRDLIDEEHREFRSADEANDLIGIADALADLIVVIIGTALEYGIDLDAVMAEVHRSNMTKTQGIRKRGDGKVLKGKFYQPPDLTRVIFSDDK